MERGEAAITELVASKGREERETAVNQRERGRERDTSQPLYYPLSTKPTQPS